MSAEMAKIEASRESACPEGRGFGEAPGASRRRCICCTCPAWRAASRPGPVRTQPRTAGARALWRVCRWCEVTVRVEQDRGECGVSGTSAPAAGQRGCEWAALRGWPGGQVGEGAVIRLHRPCGACVPDCQRIGALLRGYRQPQHAASGAEWLGGTPRGSEGLEAFTQPASRTL